MRVAELCSSFLSLSSSLASSCLSSSTAMVAVAAAGAAGAAAADAVSRVLANTQAMEKDVTSMGMATDRIRVYRPLTGAKDYSRAKLRESYERVSVEKART